MDDFYGNEVVEFEDIESDRGDLDTYQLASSKKFESLEDTLEIAKDEATVRLYDDEHDERYLAYSKCVTHLTKARDSIEALLKEIDAKMRVKSGW